jgi:hypothetical protein
MKKNSFEIIPGSGPDRLKGAARRRKIEAAMSGEVAVNSQQEANKLVDLIYQEKIAGLKADILKQTGELVSDEQADEIYILLQGWLINNRETKEEVLTKYSWLEDFFDSTAKKVAELAAQREEEE